MLGAYMNFLAISKQIETLNEYKERIKNGKEDLNTTDRDIIVNLTYSLRNTSYNTLYKLDSDNVKQYINKSLKNILQDTNLTNEQDTKSSSLNDIVETEKNNLTPKVINNAPTFTTTTTTYVNTYTDICSTQPSRKSKRIRKKPSRLGFD